VRAACADYLAAVELLSGRRASLVAALEQQVPACSHAPVIARLRCFRGIDTLSAAGLCAELGDWRRFPKPARMSGFVGIVPSEHTSDSKRRQGAITKAGPGHARRLLVEAAQHYRTAPRIGPTLAPPSRPRPARDRDRLARPTTPAPTLAAPTPHAPQALRRGRDRVARELAAFCWEAATLD
jgi:transposase